MMGVKAPRQLLFCRSLFPLSVVSLGKNEEQNIVKNEKNPRLSVVRLRHLYGSGTQVRYNNRLYLESLFSGTGLCTPEYVPVGKIILHYHEYFQLTTITMHAAGLGTSLSSRKI